MRADDVYGLEIVEPESAPEEPVSLEEAKRHLSLATADTTQDGHLTTLILAARQEAERFTNRQIVPATLLLSLKRLPDEIELPGGKVRSVTAVTYLNASGSWATASGSLYETLLTFSPPRILRKPAEQWPSLGFTANVVAKVEYEAGWADREHTPATLNRAMLLMIGYWFYDRGDSAKAGLTPESRSLPDAARHLLESWRLPQYA